MSCITCVKRDPRSADPLHASNTLHTCTRVLSAALEDPAPANIHAVVHSIAVGSHAAATALHRILAGAAEGSSRVQVAEFLEMVRWLVQRRVVGTRVVWMWELLGQSDAVEVWRTALVDWSEDLAQGIDDREYAWRAIQGFEAAEP